MDVLCRGLWELAFDYPGSEFRHLDYSALFCIALQMARRIGGLPEGVHGIWGRPISMWWSMCGCMEIWCWMV